MKVRPLTLVLLVFATIMVLSRLAFGDFDQKRWQYFKEVGVPEEAQKDYAFFQVDAETYDGCRGLLSSLRIIDSGSTEIPYQVLTKQESEKREEFHPTVLNNSYQPGAFNSFILEMGENQPSVNELTILTESKNFTRTASVEGSPDQQEWNVLVEEAHIFDFSRNIRSKYLTIGFPLSNFRYFRVKVFDDGSGPLELTGARMFKVTKEKARTELWPLTIVERKEDTEKRRTEIVFDAGYHGLPIQELTMDVTSRNYHRKVHLSSSSDREKWNPLGSGIIFDYDLPKFKKTDNRISFGQNRDGRYFKLVIENYDDQPLEITGATGIGLVRRVVLPLTGKAPFQVFFGNRQARAPQYDLAHRVRYIETERLPRLEPGPRRSNPDYVEEKPVRPWSEEHAYLLWVIMFVVIAFLAFLIVNLMKKTPPQEPGE